MPITPQEVLDMILLAEKAVTPMLELAGRLRAQSGLTDDELLTLAEQKDAATRQQVATFLARFA